MARTKEEREKKSLEAKERAEKRKAAKAAARQQAGDAANDGDGDEAKKKSQSTTTTEWIHQLPISRSHNATLPALSLPIDALSKVMRYLPAREWGAMSLTCTGYNYVLGGCRVAHLSSRLMRRQDEDGKQSTCGSMCLVGGLQLCSGRKEAQVRDYFKGQRIVALQNRFDSPISTLTILISAGDSRQVANGCRRNEPISHKEDETEEY
jgi:hypothetical protein